MVLRVSHRFSDLIRFTLVILLTALAFLIIPIAFLIFLPIYFTRFIVSQLKKVLRPDLARLVVTRSSIMAVDHWNGVGGYPKCNLVLTMCFEGKLDMEKLMGAVNEKFVHTKDKDGELIHPECHQYYEQWLGFMFWKWEKDPDVRKHVRYYDEHNLERRFTSKDLLHIEAELTGKPFTPEMSPWEVLVMPNYFPDNFKSETPKSALIFRLHHGIADYDNMINITDGYSLLNLLLREVCGLHEHQYALPHHKEVSMARRVINNLVFAIRSPYEAVKQQVECRDYNEWRIPEDRMSPNWFHAQTNPIPLELIKEVKGLHGVSFTAVLVAAITGGIRNYWLKRGRPVPHRMHGLAPFPLPNRIHTTKLRNFYTFAFLKFPVGAKTPTRRMQIIQKDLEDLKGSTSPFTNFMQIPIIGGLFAPMIEPLVKNYLSTAIMSNFPGPNETCQFLGNDVIEMGHSGGHVHGNTALGFAMLSYVGKLTIRVRGSQSIFPTEAHLEDLLNEVCLELEVLRKLEETV